MIRALTISALVAALAVALMLHHVWADDARARALDTCRRELAFEESAGRMVRNAAALDHAPARAHLMDPIIVELSR